MEHQEYLWTEIRMAAAALMATTRELWFSLTQVVPLDQSDQREVLEQLRRVSRQMEALGFVLRTDQERRVAG